MQETMMAIREMKDIEKILLDWVKEEVGKGKECFDVEAAGEVVDMIKDLSEAGEKCMKKKYYEMLICEMMSTDDMEEVGRMGYDYWRYAGSGHYAPKGHGSYSAKVRGTGRPGYIPDPERYDWERKPGRHLHAPFPYDYNLGPMGYPMEEIKETEPLKMDGMKYGEAYERYKNMKKHYTETHDESSHHQMNEHIKESARDTLMAMKDMWTDASPEVKQAMRNGVESLLAEMKKN